MQLGVAVEAELQVVLDGDDPLVGPDLVRKLRPEIPVPLVGIGGITADNLATYLAEPSVLAVGGSWLVSADLLAAQDFAQITDLAAAAVRVVRGARTGVGA